jgi:hypothetical protein
MEKLRLEQEQRKKKKELQPFRIWMTERMRARLQAAIGDGAGAIERATEGTGADEAQVKQLVIKAGFSPLQADDAIREVGSSIQVPWDSSSFQLLHSPPQLSSF